MNPFFSVIIPTYNRRNQILRSVNSVLFQTFEDFEVLIIDDCSTDDTLNLLSCLCDRRIRIFKTDGLRVPGAVRNIGIKEACGLFICFLDSDDMFRMDKLSVLHKELANSDICFGHHEALIINESSFAVKKACSRNVLEDGSNSLRQFGNGIVTSSVFVRRSFVLENHLFFSSDPYFFAWEDYEYWIRVLEFLPRTESYLFLPDKLCYVYEGYSSISRSSSAHNLYVNISEYINKEGELSPWILWACLRHGYKRPPQYSLASVLRSVVSRSHLWSQYCVFLLRRLLGRLI